MSDSPRRALKALFLLTVLVIGMVATPTVRAGEHGVCDSDSRDVRHAESAAFTLIQFAASSALDWIHQTLDHVHDAFAWFHSFVRATVGLARA